MNESVMTTLARYLEVEMAGEDISSLYTAHYCAHMRDEGATRCQQLVTRLLSIRRCASCTALAERIIGEPYVLSACTDTAGRAYFKDIFDRLDSIPIMIGEEEHSVASRLRSMQAETNELAAPPAVTDGSETAGSRENKPADSSNGDSVDDSFLVRALKRGEVSERVVAVLECLDTQARLPHAPSSVKILLGTPQKIAGRFRCYQHRMMLCRGVWMWLL